MSPSDLEILRNGLTALGLTEREGLLDDLSRYWAEWETWNEKLGLVSVRDGSEFAIRHILDSLAAAPVLASLGKTRWADLGSGAGFPGIPLALAFPDWNWTLVERMEKRARFLEGTLHALGRTDVNVVCRTFEEIKDRFEAVTFRAVTPLEPKGTKKILRLLEPDGLIAAYKARREVVEAELETLKPLDLDVRVEPLSVPGLDEERNLVVLRSRKNRTS